MEKAIYTPLAGAIAQERVLEMIANNMANVNTVAFKGDRATFTLQEPEPEKRYDSPLPPANYKVAMENLLYQRGDDIFNVGVADVSRDLSQGPAVQTQNPTDVMIEGEGFFKVQTPDGERYTRAGNFTLNRDGILSTSEGFPVMGEKGDILVHGPGFQINDSGEVWQDGHMVDRIQLVKFDDDKALDRAGMNLFQYAGTPEGVKKAASSMRQGFIEGSNVNAIKNLTDMIIAHRSYEAYQKAVQNYDKMMDKSSNAIGEVRA
jgi:flagellar basal-body rod protein FlgG